jgi:hypothetical protein
VARARSADPKIHTLLPCRWHRRRPHLRPGRHHHGLLLREVAGPRHRHFRLRLRDRGLRPLADLQPPDREARMARGHPLPSWFVSLTLSLSLSLYLSLWHRIQRTYRRATLHFLSFIPFSSINFFTRLFATWARVLT